MCRVTTVINIWSAKKKIVVKKRAHDDLAAHARDPMRLQLSRRYSAAARGRSFIKAASRRHWREHAGQRC